MATRSNHAIKPLALGRNDPGTQLLGVTKQIPGPGVITLGIGENFEDALWIWRSLARTA